MVRIALSGKYGLNRFGMNSALNSDWSTDFIAFIT